MRWKAAVIAVAALGCTAPARAAEPPTRPAAKSPRDGWSFRFRKFVIGAWWGPGPTEAEVKLYAEAGFNVVMCGRYMQLEGYGDPNRLPRELALAAKHGLGVMLDTYTRNDRPWGGRAGQVDGHPTHHAASLVELRWLHERVGRHRALVGYMIGDDKSALTPRLADCTSFLRRAAPHLMPWICQNVPNAASLARHGNPIFNVQIYPTLYRPRLPAGELARRYCLAYAKMRRESQRHDLIMWPMLNVARQQKDARTGFAHLQSDSLVRFPVYAAVAYGSQGIWYFTYNGGALQAAGRYSTERQVRAALTPLYPVAKKANLRIAAWGPSLLGRTCAGLFATAWARGDWPFADDAASPGPEALAAPAPGKLVQAMSDDVLVGVLTARGAAPLAMAVDGRASKAFGDLPRRRVTLRFHDAVEGIRVLDGNRSRHVRGRDVHLDLDAGEGQLLELAGRGLPAVTTSRSIYARPAAAAPPPRKLAAKDLVGIRAAKIRIDVFGADAGAKYRDKQVVLNGRPVGLVPANARDAWDRVVLDLKPAQLRLVRKHNAVTLRGPGVAADAWKVRHVTLAAQLADGTWARTAAHKATWSAKDWAHFEGTAIPDTGTVGPIELAFD